MNTKINEKKTIEYSCNGKIIKFNKPLIMSIVNITPDSFYDGGKYDSESDVLKDVEEKINSGANIIDIGASSTRPNSDEITEKEEWKRLKDVLISVRANFPDILLSVDTYRASVAKKSAEHGIDIINDISGGNLDSLMFKTVADLNIPYILMHIQGKPKTMQNNPKYLNVVEEVKKDFESKITQLINLGFNKIILDPGFGFGKSLENNYQLLKSLNIFSSFNYPILAGVSRKSMINRVIGTNPVTALNGTTVLNTIALQNGASILRVHDAFEAKQAIELVEFYKSC
jgi:dihydropteroate synthase